MGDDITEAIEGLTRRLHAYRVFENFKRGNTQMPLEIKGLKGKALKAGAMFDRLNRAYDKLIDSGDAHATDVEGLAPQIDALQEDITFSVQTLGNALGGSGNGSGESEKPKEKPAVIPAIQQPETPKPAPASFELKPGTTPEQNMKMLEQTGAPAVAQQPAPTFPDA